MSEKQYPDIMPEIGRKYKEYYGDNNINNRIIHVLHVTEHHVMIRWWSKAKQRWRYGVKEYRFFYYGFRDGGYLSDHGKITPIKE